MTNPVLSPEIRPEWRKAAIEAVNALEFNRSYTGPTSLEILNTTLAATAGLIAAAARAEAIEDAEAAVRKITYLSIWAIDAAVAAIRSLIPEATESKPPLPPVNRLLGITVDDEPAVSLTPNFDPPKPPYGSPERAVYDSEHSE